MQIAPELASMFLGTPAPEADASEDRLIYAAFPPGLRAAMRTAAQRQGWTRDDWRLQTQMIHDALMSGHHTIPGLIYLYENLPEGMEEIG